MLSHVSQWPWRAVRRLAISLIYVVVLCAGPLMLVAARLWMSWNRWRSRRMLRQLIAQPRMAA